MRGPFVAGRTIERKRELGGMVNAQRRQRYRGKKKWASRLGEADAQSSGMRTFPGERDARCYAAAPEGRGAAR
jgi:hypothetical protein